MLMCGRSCVDDVDRSTKGVHKVLDVMFIAGDNDITASDCPHNDGGVDQIGCLGASACCPRRASAQLVERLDPASLQKPRQLRLGTTTPGLAEHPSWQRRANPSPQSPPVQRPDGSIAPLRCD